LPKSEVYLMSLIKELAALPYETGWVEFKVNNVKPDEIGEYISALSNTAALDVKPNAYLIWGIDNKNHDLVGTNFKPSDTKVGNEEIESWLLRLLTPRINFCFYEITVDTKKIVILEPEFLI